MREIDSLCPEIITQSLIATALSTLDGRCVLANQAMSDFLGHSAEALIGMNWRDVIAPPGRDEVEVPAVRELLNGSGETYRAVNEYLRSDGRRVWGDLHLSCLSEKGGARYLLVQVTDVTDQVLATKELEESRQRVLQAAERQRKIADTSIVPAALSRSDGSLAEVNPAMCKFLGYDADTLLGMTWMDLVAPEDLDEAYQATQELIAGQRDSYRGHQQLIAADGRRLIVDLSMACNRRANGDFESVIAQIIDITSEMQAREQLAERESQLSAELASAARYVESLLPADLSGKVEVSSRYLPSFDVGGDCFDYSWIDDDTLMLYVIDVSGHGVRPALLSVSIHNLVRSGTLPASILLRPDRLLSKLNSLFRMEDQDETYFTMWYCLYEPSTRTLSYANAGSPPALALYPTPSGEWRHTPLSTPGMPVGMFGDSRYDVQTFEIPRGGQLLLFSDGAFELPLVDGSTGTLAEFTEVALSQLRRGDFSSDTLIEQLKAVTVDGQFADDFLLITVDFG